MNESVCRYCGRPFQHATKRQVLCSNSCRRLENVERVKASGKRTRRAADLMSSLDPLVARALALTMWPDLRTPEEQSALDAYLARRIADGIADWSKLARDIRGDS